MKKPKDTLVWITVAAGILALFSVILMVLALSDIHSDYISATALEKAGQPAPQWLADYNHCRLEWTSLTVMWIVLLVFFILLTITALTRDRHKRDGS